MRHLHSKTLPTYCCEKIANWTKDYCTKLKNKLKALSHNRMKLNKNTDLLYICVYQTIRIWLKSDRIHCQSLLHTNSGRFKTCCFAQDTSFFMFSINKRTMFCSKTFITNKV